MVPIFVTLHIGFGFAPQLCKCTEEVCMTSMHPSVMSVGRILITKHPEIHSTGMLSSLI